MIARTVFASMSILGLLTACATTPEPEPEPVVIAPVPVKSCTPISNLERIVIPAETEKFYAITEIENEPYDPIVRREERVRVVKEEQVLYVDKEGREVTDICEEQLEDGAQTPMDSGS